MRPISEWRIVGFTSERGAHQHLLKHVLRTTEVEEALSRDPEAWEELMDRCGLPSTLARRREVALKRLLKVPACPAGQAGVTRGRPCERCQDRAAQLSISQELGDFMGDYLSAAANVIEHARVNPARHGPRVLVYRSAERLPTVVAFDARHVMLVGALDEKSGAVSVVTCYRDKQRSLRSHDLEIARNRAKHRAAGTLVEVG